MRYAIEIRREPVAGPRARTLACDVDAGDALVVADAADGDGPIVAVNGTARRFVQPVRYPDIRALGDRCALLFGLRTGRDVRANGWILDEHLGVRRELALGDAIEDVVVTESHVVVTYFDEGVFGHDPLSHNGISVFARGGDFQWGWNASHGGRPEVYDCYAAVGCGRNTIGAHVYGAYRDQSYFFAVLDAGRRSATIHAVPEVLHFTHALTCAADGTWLFAARVGEERRIMAWHPGSAEIAGLSEPVRVTRGLPDGRFISVSAESVELISVSLRAEEPNGSTAALTPGEEIFFEC